MNLDQFESIVDELRALGCPHFQPGCSIEGKTFILVASMWLCGAYDECICIAEGRKFCQPSTTRDLAVSTLLDLGFCETDSSALALIDGDNPEFLRNLTNIVKAARSLYPPGYDPEESQDSLHQLLYQDDAEDPAAASIISRMDHVFANDYSMFSTESLSKLPLSDPLGDTTADNGILKASNSSLRQPDGIYSAAATPVKFSKNTGADAALSDASEYWRSAADKCSTRALDEVDSRRAEDVTLEFSNRQDHLDDRSRFRSRANAPHGDATIESMRQALDGALSASTAAKKRAHVLRAIAALESAEDDEDRRWGLSA